METAVTFSSIMGMVSDGFETCIDMVGTVASTVVQHPILFLGTIIGLCGIGIGFFNRLRH